MSVGGYSPNQMRMNMNNMNNYNMSFQPNQNVIPVDNFTNLNNLIHNNLNTNVFTESVMDTCLHVDSNDRDTATYSNPFKFIVSLGGAGTSSDKVFDTTTQTYKTVNYTGVPGPRIEKSFRNIKYFQIDRVFFSKSIKFGRIIPDAGAPAVFDYIPIIDTKGINQGAISKKYRYLVVRIKELDNNRVCSTNTNVSDDSFIIYRDRDLGGCDAEIWVAAQPKRVYLKSALKNLDRLTIEIVDNNGNQIQNTFIAGSLGTEAPNIGLFVADETAVETPIPLTELTNATRSDQYQLAFQFTVGLYENELNTNVNYT